jgi:hypothetical protein
MLPAGVLNWRMVRPLKFMNGPFSWLRRNISAKVWKVIQELGEAQG